jgi:menaquinone-dependent protoporphyrinogen IX oxidase
MGGADISIGSMLDVGWGDLIDYLGDDPRAQSILIYLESIGDARAFLSAAREVALSKPIIVLKAGRTAAAAKAAASHTGALTGSDEVLAAAFRRCGGLRYTALANSSTAGSSADVAAAIDEELGRGGAQVDVRRMSDVADLGYAAVIVGGPLIWSAWHPEAVGFVTRQQRALSQMPVAYFITALHLTQTAATQVDAVPVYLDPALATPPRCAGQLSFTERYATVEHYLVPVLQKAPLVKPVSVGFFAGKLDYRTLTLPKRLFARIVIRKPGDFRNWPAIHAWAAEMRPLIQAQEPTDRPDARDLEIVVAETSTV